MSEDECDCPRDSSESHHWSLFMQDESGGPWSGIYVNVKICEFPDISCVSSADGKLLSPDYYMNRGTAWVVEVLGTIMEINGTTASSSVSNIRFIRNDTMPAPTVIATGSIGYNCSSLGKPTKVF